MNEPHLVKVVDTQSYLCCVEPDTVLLHDVVMSVHQGQQVPTTVILHSKVEKITVLECIIQLREPRTVIPGHNIPLLRKEGRGIVTHQTNISSDQVKNQLPIFTGESSLSMPAIHGQIS